MHLEGEAALPDVKEAALWFKSAAEQGHAEAQVSLGMLHALGKGVEKNLVVAHKWVSLAAAQDYVDAKAALVELEGRLTPGELEQSAELVSKWNAPQAATVSEPEKTKEGEPPENK